MTTLDTLIVTSEESDRARYKGLWLRTWVALAAIVILVVISYLVFISNSLAGINGNLQVARDAVTDVNGNTKTLPGQIDAVNSNLKGINNSLEQVPGQVGDIRTNLTSINETGTTINSSLADTSAQLDQVASDLDATVPKLTTVSGNLTDTSSLLVSILKSTTTIDNDLLAIQGRGPSGVLRVNDNVTSINSALAPTKQDLGDILAGLGVINGHLDDVCRSVPINLLHGRQPC